jgi:Domain of unknown function (DUF5069)
MNIENLRSPHETIGGLNYLPRLLDKIRLHGAGQLPKEYQANLGEGFDGRCVKFLGVDYAALRDRVLQGGSDQEILEWCHSQGLKPSDEQIEVWNQFMRKRGWNDEASPMLARRLEEGGLEHRRDIQTFFDYIDLDEGRDPLA